MEQDASQTPTWREHRHHKNGDGGLSLPRWFMTVSGGVYLMAIPWAIWVTNTLYAVKYSTESLATQSARLDRLADQIHDLEVRFARSGVGSRAKGE